MVWGLLIFISVWYLNFERRDVDAGEIPVECKCIKKRFLSLCTKIGNLLNICLFLFKIKRKCPIPVFRKREGGASGFILRPGAGDGQSAKGPCRP